VRGKSYERQGVEWPGLNTTSSIVQTARVQRGDLQFANWGGDWFGQ
jgi:hypothetical protein